MVHYNNRHKIKPKRPQPGSSNTLGAPFYAGSPAPAPVPPQSTTSTLAPSPSQTPVFEMKGIDGKGMGVVAIRDLEAGTLVLREVPIVVWNEEDGTSKLESLVSALSDRQRADYYSLYISPKAKKMEKALAVFRTNAMQLGPQSSKGGIFVEGSRFNHSCRPNVQRHWEEEQGVEWFILSHDVKKGEELCIAYQETRASRETRRERLWEGFGFECNCSACSLSEVETEVSDNHRVQIKALDNSLTSLQTQPLQLVKTVNRIIRLLKKEDLVTCRADAAFAAMGVCVWDGDRVNAGRWIERILEYEKVEAGVWSTKYREVEAWKDDPARHPAWSINSRMMGTPPKVLAGPE
ncbi:hypothetical protein JCM5350_002718 [Sporobolomyces pararoseus]